jgi:hypothetical protein
MSMLPRRRFLSLLPSAACVLPALARAQGQPKAPLVVICGARSTLHDLSLPVLRAMFLGDEAKAPDGSRLVPFNQPPNSNDRVAFDRLVLGKSPAEVSKYWIDRRIRGEGRPPKVVTSPLDAVALLRQLVAVFPGAISYLRADQIDASVRVVRIGGKLPADAGYPLKE